VTQTTPGAEGGGTATLLTGITTQYYRCREMQIQKLIFAVDFFFESSGGVRRPIEDGSIAEKSKRWITTQNL
jgi:hypothetical protein